VSEWKKNKETWCDNESAKSDELPSSLICYPYHQVSARTYLPFMKYVICRVVYMCVECECALLVLILM
jgi:hypothetical protein